MAKYRPFSLSFKIKSPYSLIHSENAYICFVKKREEPVSRSLHKTAVYIISPSLIGEK